MRHFILFFALACLLTSPAGAATPARVFAELKSCVMANEPDICRGMLTSSSHTLYDRFASYGLMICLPTDFEYEKSVQKGGYYIVTAASGDAPRARSRLRLAFTAAATPKLDVPQTLRLGLGENWQNKISLAEQLYLLMRQNMGSQLTCDQVAPLIK